MDVKLAVIYYSATGTTYQLARGIEAGAQTAGAEVRVRKVHESVPDDVIEGNAAWAAHRRETQDVAEANLDDLVWADAIVFGSPTRYGLPSARSNSLSTEPDRCGRRASPPTRSAHRSPVPPLRTAGRK